MTQLNTKVSDHAGDLFFSLSHLNHNFFYLNKEQMTCIGFVFDVLYVYFMIVMLLVRLMGHLVLSVNLTSHKPGK